MDSSSEIEDAGPIMTDPDSGLSALAGRYLMRVDTFSRVTAMDTGTGATLALKTRISNLFYTELSVADGVLRSSEKLCDQVASNDCTMGCSTPWRTTYATAVVNKIQAKDPLVRVYDVDADMNLSVASAGALLPLGFDEPSPTPGVVPLSTADARVWKLDPTMPTTLRGVVTNISTTLVAGSFSAQLDCDVYNVQLYATAFRAKLASLSPAELANHVMEANTEGTFAKILDTVRTQDLANVCTPESLESNSEGSVEQAFVRFMPTTLTRCPADAEAFEREFPPGPSLDAPTVFDPKP